MNVLGLSAFYHDASAALIRDGRVVASVAEERLTLQKHDQSFPRLAIAACLDHAGLRPQDLDAVVFHEQPHAKFPRVLASCFAGFPRSLGTFTRAMKSWLGSKLWVRNEISKRLGVPAGRVHCVEHHASHAAQAFAASPFREAAILVVDAVGEWACTSLYKGRIGDDRSLELTQLLEIPYPHSLGLVYSVFTAFLGFKVNDGECSTMALSTFGQPRYVEAIRRIVKLQSDGTYEVDPAYFEFDRMSGAPFSRRFVEVFGAPRDWRAPLPFDALPDAGPAVASADDQRHADIAASLQVVLEEVLSALGAKLRALSGSRNLCFAGGVALNCVANRRLLDAGLFEQVFVPPDPGDGGGAIGAGLYGAFLGLGEDCAGFQIHPYLGCEYSEQADLAMLAHVRPQAWQASRDAGAARLPANLRLEIRRHEDFERTVAETVQDLQAGRIVGWFQGRFENGPRALGNRSILIQPGNTTLARRLGAATKRRAPFRPYALAMTAEAAPGLLTGARSGLERWMQTTSRVAPGVAGTVAAAMHHDGTTRPQVCTAADNARFHTLLAAQGRASGTAALLNTSFNLSGLPMAATPSDALLMFARTDIDTLVLGNTLVRKVS